MARIQEICNEVERVANESAEIVQSDECKEAVISALHAAKHIVTSVIKNGIQTVANMPDEQVNEMTQPINDLLSMFNLKQDHVTKEQADKVIKKMTDKAEEILDKEENSEAAESTAENEDA